MFLRSTTVGCATESSLLHRIATLILVVLASVLPIDSQKHGMCGENRSAPNIVVILADDLGYADLSCYGNDRFTTPHLDQLAREGLRFTDFHANGAVCSPTRAALVTGRYQQRTGVDEVLVADPAKGMRETAGLHLDERTFADLLGAAGYRTALMGKWHLGYAERFHPLRRGFQEFHGYLSGNVDYHSHIDQADFADWWRDDDLHEESGYSTHIITAHALRFIEAHRREPFCLYVAHEAVHYPYQGPNDPPIRGPQRHAPLQGKEIQRAYGQMLEELDSGVGQIVALLRRLELDRNTLVFFFSDNGGTPQANNAPLSGFKGSLLEGGHRVPAIAWWPGQIAPGRTTTQTTLSMDLLPTMLDLAGVPVPTDRKLDGTSLVPLLLRDEPLPSRTLFWQFHGQQAVRQGPWKLLANESGARAKPAKKKAQAAQTGPRLFNLAEDIAERQDLAAQQPDKVRELTAALEAWCKEVSGRTAE